FRLPTPPRRGKRIPNPTCIYCLFRTVFSTLLQHLVSDLPTIPPVFRNHRKWLRGFARRWYDAAKAVGCREEEGRPALHFCKSMTEHYRLSLPDTEVPPCLRGSPWRNFRYSVSAHGIGWKRAKDLGRWTRSTSMTTPFSQVTTMS